MGNYRAHNSAITQYLEKKNTDECFSSGMTLLEVVLAICRFLNICWLGNFTKSTPVIFQRWMCWVLDHFSASKR